MILKQQDFISKVVEATVRAVRAARAVKYLTYTLKIENRPIIIERIVV